MSAPAPALPGGAVLGLIAFYCGKGRRAARVFVWIVCAAQWFNALNVQSLYAHGFYARHSALLLPMTLILSSISVVGYTIASVLLARPEAREFFRKPTATPLPVAADPAQP
jgi:hypothetical protein